MWTQLPALVVTLIGIGVAAEWFGSRRRLAVLRRHAAVLELLPEGSGKEAFRSRVEELAIEYLSWSQVSREFRARTVVLTISGIAWLGAATLAAWDVVLGSAPAWVRPATWVLLGVFGAAYITHRWLRRRMEHSETEV